MALGSASSYQPVPGSEVAALIKNAYGPLAPFNGNNASGAAGSGPAVYYSLPGFTGKIGFINPVTHGFCETCNRLRLSAEGFLKLCLSSDIGIDLRTPIRSGARDDELACIITGAIAQKKRFHSFSNIYDAPEAHPDGMSKIGG